MSCFCLSGVCGLWTFRQLLVFSNWKRNQHNFCMFFMKVVNIYVQNILFNQINININHKLWTEYMYYTQIKIFYATHCSGAFPWKRQTWNRKQMSLPRVLPVPFLFKLRSFEQYNEKQWSFRRYIPYFAFWCISITKSPESTFWTRCAPLDNKTIYESTLWTKWKPFFDKMLNIHVI